MSEETPNPSGERAARPQREPTTIDLSATEVPPPDATDGADAAAATPPARGLALPMIGAAIGGAAISMFLLAVLTLTGAWPRDDAAVTGLAARVARIEAQPAPEPSPPDTRAIDALAARVDKIETAQATPASPPPADPALANRVAAAETGTRQLADALNALHRRNDEIVAALRDARQRVDAVAKAVSDLQAADRSANSNPADKDALDTLSARLSALENSTRHVEQKLETPTSTDRALRVAMLATALKDAVERGGPFAPELAALKPLVDAQALSALEPFATAGVPRAPALAGELHALMPRIAQAVGQAVGQAEPGSGLIARLQASASRLVRIRPLDTPPGDEPADILARLEASASRGDVASALSDIAKLPPPARAVAAGWVTRAEARAAAISAAEKLSASALGAVGKAS